jgi:flagellar biosynthesis protein FliP
MWGRLPWWIAGCVGYNLLRVHNALAQSTSSDPVQISITASSPSGDLALPLQILLLLTILTFIPAILIAMS